MPVYDFYLDTGVSFRLKPGESPNSDRAQEKAVRLLIKRLEDGAVDLNWEEVLGDAQGTDDAPMTCLDCGEYDCRIEFIPDKGRPGPLSCPKCGSGNVKEEAE
jgi:hypothetical protein